MHRLDRAFQGLCCSDADHGSKEATGDYVVRMTVREHYINGKSMVQRAGSIWPRQKCGGEEDPGNMRHTVRRIHWSLAVPNGQRQILFLFIAHTFTMLVGCGIALVAISRGYGCSVVAISVSGQHCLVCMF